MTIDIALALMVGAVLGVFSTIVLIGLAFAVREHKQNKQEETEQHE